MLYGRYKKWTPLKSCSTASTAMLFTSINCCMSCIHYVNEWWNKVVWLFLQWGTHQLRESRVSFGIQEGCPGARVPSVQYANPREAWGTAWHCCGCPYRQRLHVGSCQEQKKGNFLNYLITFFLPYVAQLHGPCFKAQLQDCVVRGGEEYGKKEQGSGCGCIGGNGVATVGHAVA
jgi:hypothetical protein